MQYCISLNPLFVTLFRSKLQMAGFVPWNVTALKGSHELWTIAVSCNLPFTYFIFLKRNWINNYISLKIDFIASNQILFTEGYELNFTCYDSFIFREIWSRTFTSSGTRRQNRKQAVRIPLSPLYTASLAHWAGVFILQMTVFCGMRGDQVTCLHIADRKRSSLSFDYPTRSSTLQRLSCNPYRACEFTVRGWEVSSTLTNKFHPDIRVSWFKTPKWHPAEPKHRTYRNPGPVSRRTR